ncbi:MAG: hypothetical protein VB858_22215 [Planctomycetaceae bacterium]
MERADGEQKSQPGRLIAVLRYVDYIRTLVLAASGLTIHFKKRSLFSKTLRFMPQIEIRTGTDQERQQETGTLAAQSAAASLSAQFIMPPDQNRRTSIGGVSELDYHNGLKHSIKLVERGRVTREV